MEEFRQRGNILFGHSSKASFTGGRMCCCLEGSVLAVGGECEAIRSMSVCENTWGLKDCEFSPCKTPLRTLKSLSWAKDGTNQRKQQRHFNKHTQTHMLSHSANRLFRSFSDLAFALMTVFTLQYMYREMQNRGWGNRMWEWRLPGQGFSSSFSLTTAPFLCSLVPSSLSFLAIPFPTFHPSLFLPPIYRGSWWDSGTCTYRRHREVCVHSPGCSWGPVRGVPLGSSSGRPLLQGMGDTCGMLNPFWPPATKNRKKDDNSVKV